MSLLTPLIAFNLRRAVAEPDAEVAALVAGRLARPTAPLPAALTYAADRTWRALAAAVAPGRFLNVVRSDGAGDAVWIEAQLRRFTDQTRGRFGDAPDALRLACLSEWRQAVGRTCGRAWEDHACEELVRLTAELPRADAELARAADAAEAQVVDELAVDCPQLAQLLRRQTADPPLLTAAFAYFFRREVESNEQLSGEWMCDGLRRLSAPLAGGLAGLSQALARLGSRFDVLIGQLLDAQPARGSEAGARGAGALPAHLAARPAPFQAMRRPPKGASGVRRAASRSSISAARSSGCLLAPAPTPAAPGALPPTRPGPSFVHSLGMPFVWVPPGEFRMGSPPDEARRDADERPRTVRITRGFFLGAHPVTRGQFRAFVRDAKYVTEAERTGGAHRGPSGEWKLDAWCSWKRPDFPQDDDHPVVCVSWNDAQAFCAWLGGRESQRAGTYRLPTEAEWERACRAGTTGRFWPGDALCTDQANFDGAAGGAGGAPGLFREGTTPVWIFPPNPWGLFDIHGNAWEWCADWYGPYPDGEVVDPQGPASGRCRVLRGGSWRNQVRFLRSAARNQLTPSGRDRDTGFRVCLGI